MVCGHCPPYGTTATWKVIVVLDPGQRIDQINENTRIISVVTPNTEKPSDPDQLERWRNWRNWRYSVDFIESQTGLDLLTNIPENIQNILEARVDTSASLTADFQDSFITTSDNSYNLSSEPIWPLNILPLRTSSPTNESSLISKSSLNSAQIGSSQVRFFQDSTTQVGTTQVGTTQVGTTQLNPLQLSMSEIDLRKFPFSSSITLQQLLSSHNPNLQNTTVPTWTEFLQPPTPFNLKIEIQDLPTGQLAEDTITGYDTNNRPNSGIPTFIDGGLTDTLVGLLGFALLYPTYRSKT